MGTRFTVAYWCVLLAALLPYACAYLAKSGGFGKPRSQGGYDNQDPRAWLARQTDWRARANAAQANTFEALPFFFAAVLIAHQRRGASVMLRHAGIPLLFRVLHDDLCLTGQHVLEMLEGNRESGNDAGKIDLLSESQIGAANGVCHGDMSVTW
jgi:uncharacterized MAPEG superfamily protein